MAPKDNKGDIDASASHCGFSWYILTLQLGMQYWGSFSFPQRNSVSDAAAAAFKFPDLDNP